MENHEHFRKLERMYATAPINEYYQPRLKVSAGSAELEIQVQEKFSMRLEPSMDRSISRRWMMPLILMPIRWSKRNLC